MTLVDGLLAGAKDAFDQTFAVSTSTASTRPSAEVRKGDADAAIEMRGRHARRALHADRPGQGGDHRRARWTRSSTAPTRTRRGSQPALHASRPQRVEDESLKTIQFVTPGLLGWAVAMSAAFGAAATLQGWRNSKLLRRLQLSPVSARTVVSARVVVTVLIALLQMAIFVGARHELPSGSS